MSNIGTTLLEKLVIVLEIIELSRSTYYYNIEKRTKTENMGKYEQKYKNK